MVVVCGSSPQDSISFVIMIKTMLVVRDPFKLWKRKHEVQTLKSIRTPTPRDSIELSIRQVPSFLSSPPHRSSPFTWYLFSAAHGFLASFG